MSRPSPASVLRHRGPALLLEAVEALEDGALRCRSSHAGSWTWPRVLEGAAQTAGLLAGLQPGGVTNAAVIAEYRGVVIHAPAHEGPIHFHAHVERRLLRFWRCRVAARAPDTRLLLEASVTLAPGRGTAP